MATTNWYGVNERTKIVIGPDGAAVEVSQSDPLPVTLVHPDADDAAAEADVLNVETKATDIAGMILVELQVISTLLAATQTDSDLASIRDAIRANLDL